MVVLQHLRRVRWAVRATLFLGVAASVVANVLHALDNPISQAIAAWPPLALLLTVELISRVPVHRRWLAATRLLATATIAGIAAWVSYWHMAGVAARYGETGASPYLLPLSVDGLIVVASICLVELGGRIASLENPADPVADPVAETAPAPAQPSVPGLVPSPSASGSPVPAGANGRGGMDRRTRAEIAAALSRKANEDESFTPTVTRRPRQPVAAGRAVPAQRSTAASRATTSQAVPPPQARGAARPGNARGTAKPEKKERRSPAETVALANRIKAERPQLTEAEIAAELGISASRWRTVRREAAVAA
ncbi:DUF2637 domain-containing protein [Actinoplanes sp. KI2]|uniref:DUF2637 domain-containing protein n=1 Tax=Actinoplanes sp. KI2 TaxID=2983315 RepID=UPI00398304E7